MVTRPHSDLPFTGIPLLVLRIGLAFGAATLSFKYVEEPIRGGAIGRWLASYRRSTGERRRQMTRGLGVITGGLALALLVIVIGLSGGTAPARPPGVPDAAALVLGPEDVKAPSGSTTTLPGAPTTTTLAPTGAAYRVLAIGDSVMQGAGQTLNETLNGVRNPSRVDAAQNRQFSSGVDQIQTYADSGQLGDVVVVHLGTNGTVNPDDFDRMMNILAGVRKVVVLTAKAPRPWEEQVNGTIFDKAKNYRNVVVLDWHTIGGAHPEYFWDDSIHLRPEGAQAYSQLILSNL
jgi:hypothetical protein